MMDVPCQPIDPPSHKARAMQRRELHAFGGGLTVLMLRANASLDGVGSLDRGAVSQASGATAVTR